MTAALQNDLARGRVAIAKLNDRYELLPAAAAEKIMQRDQQVIVVLNKNEQRPKWRRMIPMRTTRSPTT